MGGKSWAFLEISQVLWGGRGTPSSLPGDSITLGAARKRQAKCGCHSWALVWSQPSCVLPSPQPSWGVNGPSITSIRKCVCACTEQTLGSFPRSSQSSPSKGGRHLVTGMNSTLFLIPATRKKITQILSLDRVKTPQEKDSEYLN